MNDAVQTTLRDLVRREGAAVYTDPRRCEAMLRDVAGDSGREIFVLVTAVRAGVVDDLLNASTGFEDVVAARAVSHLADDFGLDHEAAAWAVSAWSAALGLLPPGSQAAAPAPHEPPAPPPQLVSVPSGPPATSFGEDVTRTVGPPGVAAYAGAVGAPSGPTAAPPTGPPTGPPPGPPTEAYEMAWPPSGVPGGPPPGGPPKHRRRWIPIAALVAVAALLIASVVVLTSHKASAGEIFLEPATIPGQLPAFTPTVDTAPHGPLPNLPITLPTLATPARGTTTVVGVSGEQPGLYGGTRNNASCNVQQMLDYLNANVDKARAWAAAEGIPVADLPNYLATLTPTILRTDTRVTNHGFRNGQATAIQSVLQAGTAVLVDRLGIPRTRCACGNPLKPPVAVRSTPRYTGSRWTGFNPSTVAVVSPSPVVINNFTIVDVTNGQPYTVPSGTPNLTGATPTTTTPTAPASTAVPTTIPPTTLTVPPNLQLGTGDIQVTLLWNTSADLDVHVVDPAGEEISFETDTSASGGQLDHDDRPDCSDSPTTHVEHIFWNRGTAPTGTYKVWVKAFESCSISSPYQLQVDVNQRVVSSTQGTLAQEEQTSQPINFQFGS